MTPRATAGDVLSRVELHWIAFTSTGRDTTGVFLEDLDDDELDGLACVECGCQASELVCVAQGPHGPLFACRGGCPDYTEPPRKELT